jgi:hypothetical protein
MTNAEYSNTTLKKTINKQSNINNIILEDGYNSDYIYSMVTALFYVPTDGTNRMINNDSHDVNAYYIQEFIKSKFIYPIHRSMSIESNVVNKFRLFLYNCGWLKNDDRHILEKGELDKFYLFLMGMMGQNINFTVVDATNNTTKDIPCGTINITDKHMIQETLEGRSEPRVVNLSSAVERWIKEEILKQNISYKFENVPYIIPIIINIKDPDTCLNKRYINVMEGLNFPDSGDKIQRMLIWEFHSMICQNEKGDYYSLVINHNDDMMGFSDKQIPSNWKVDITNVSVVKKIMREIKLVFYKLQ